jgi:hypothetical protein
VTYLPEDVRHDRNEWEERQISCGQDPLDYVPWDNWPWTVPLREDEPEPIEDPEEPAEYTYGNPDFDRDFERDAA